MNDYQPTDEQIEALAQGSTSDSDWRLIPDYARDLFRKWKREDVAKPAIQAIIRAAQAEVVKAAIRKLEESDSTETALGGIAYPLSILDDHLAEIEAPNV